MIGLAYGAASLVFHGITGSPLGATVPLGGHVPAWILAVTVACLAKWSVDTGLVLPALKSSYPGKVREMLLSGEALQNDVAELCVAVLVTLAIAVSPAGHCFRGSARCAAPALLPSCPAGDRVPH